MASIATPQAVGDRPEPRRVIRVLIVDDNEADRELTVHWLGEVWPFEREMSIVHAATPAEALDRMLSMRLSLVVLDWNMPTMTGGELLARMRKYGIDLPVVVLSGLEREEIQHDLESLAAAFLNKNEVNASRFENAIARSLLLRERLPKPALLGAEPPVPALPVAPPPPVASAV